MEYSEFDHWEFVYDEVLGWTWRRFAADGHLRMPSRTAFGSLDDCVSDAKLYGFVDYEPTSEGEFDLQLNFSLPSPFGRAMPR